MDWTETSGGEWLLAVAWGPAGTGGSDCAATIAVWCFGRPDPAGDRVLKGLSPPQLLSVFQPATVGAPSAQETVTSLSWLQPAEAAAAQTTVGVLAICQPSATTVVGVAGRDEFRPRDARTLHRAAERPTSPHKGRGQQQQRQIKLLCQVPAEAQPADQPSPTAAAAMSRGKSRWISCCWLSAAAVPGSQAVLMLLSRSRICLVVLAEDGAAWSATVCEVTHDQLETAMTADPESDGMDSGGSVKLPPRQTQKNFDSASSSCRFGDFRAATVLATPSSGRRGVRTSAVRVVLTTDSPALERSLFSAVKSQRIDASEHGLLEPADLAPATLQARLQAIISSGPVISPVISIRAPTSSVPGIFQISGGVESVVSAAEVIDLRGRLGDETDAPSASALDCSTGAVPSFLMLNHTRGGPAAASVQPSMLAGSGDSKPTSCQVVVLDLAIERTHVLTDLGARILAVTAAGTGAAAAAAAAAPQTPVSLFESMAADQNSEAPPMEPNRWDLLTAACSTSQSQENAESSIFVASTETGAESVWHFSASGPAGEPSLSPASRSFLGRAKQAGANSVTARLRLRGLQVCREGDRQTRQSVLVLAGQPPSSTATLDMQGGRTISAQASGGGRSGLGLPGLTLSTKVVTALTASIFTVQAEAAPPPPKPEPTSDGSDVTGGAGQSITRLLGSSGLVATSGLPEPPMQTKPAAATSDGAACPSMPRQEARSAAGAAHGVCTCSLAALSEEETAAWVGEIVRSSGATVVAACVQNRIDGAALLVLCGADMPRQFAFNMLRDELKVVAFGDRLRLFDEIRRAPA